MEPMVVVVGSVNEDLVTRVPRLPSPGETVIGGIFTRGLGGKGANKAVAAARLGARTWLVGLVGGDAAGRLAREALAEQGVDVGCLGTGSAATGTAQILVEIGSGENLIAVAAGANGELSAEGVKGALERIGLPPGSVVLADLEVPDEAVVAAARYARERGASFVLNPAPGRPLSTELLALCTVLTPNEHEVRLLGARSPGELLEQGVGTVVVTRGAHGADLHRPGGTLLHQPAFRVRTVDSTGAGDAFSAALAWSLAAGRSIEEALPYAAGAGGLASEGVGAQGSLPDAMRLEAFLLDRSAEADGAP